MIYLIATIGLFLRLGVLRMQGTGWFDELFSLHFASLPFGEAFPLLLQDIHPPLYALTLRLWVAVFGETLSSARVLSLLLGTLLIFFVARLVKSLTGRDSAAILAAVLTAFSPVLLFHSAEARMYPLLLVLTAVAIMAHLRLIEDEEGYSGRKLMAWGMANAAMLLVHATALIPFLIMAAHGVSKTRGGRSRAGPFFITVLGVSIPFLSWAAWYAASRGMGILAEWQLQSSGSASSLGVLSGFYVEGLPEWVAFICAIAIVGLVLAALFSVQLSRGGLIFIPERDSRLWLMTALAVIPFAVLLPFGTSTIKYHFVAYPAITALVATGGAKLLDMVKDARVMKTAAGLAFTTYMVLISGPLAVLVTERRIQWDTALDHIVSQEHEGDLIYLAWFISELPVNTYYDGGLPIASAYPFDTTLTFDERLVRHAGQRILTEQVFADLESSVEGSRRVFLVTGRPDFVTTPIQRWFFERGWRLLESFEINGFSPTILLMEHP